MDQSEKIPPKQAKLRNISTSFKKDQEYLSQIRLKKKI